MSQFLDPLHDNVVIRRAEATNRSEGGILLPDTAKEKPKRGTVVSVGPGRINGGTFEETTLKAGYSVIFSAYAGSEVDLDGETFLIMKESEVLAVFVKKAK